MAAHRPSDWTAAASDSVQEPVLEAAYSRRRFLVSSAAGAAGGFVLGSAPGIAHAQTPATKTREAPLAASDTYFVTQTSLGTPFQVDSGRLAQAKGGTAAIRSYAQLMVSSHIAVYNTLEGILRRKPPAPPPTLLKAAYATMLATLQHETGQTFDADYVRGQVNYQKANAALYQYEIANGSDPDLKAFAQQTLPKIQDHLARALNL
jgi:putative membrane protein